MKANVVLLILSIMAGTLLAYFVYDVALPDNNSVICGIGAFVCFGSTLIPAVGLKYRTNKLGINIRILSALFFVLFAISQFCFAGFGIKIPYYAIVNGLILISFLAIFYKMQKITNI